MPVSSIYKVGVIMNGVTGRMGTNQHLIRSVLAIIEEGGLPIDDGRLLLPIPTLVGRNPSKVEQLARRTGIEKWTTVLEEALEDKQNLIYFDSQSTQQRVSAVTTAIEAGKHIYCEKPTATTTDDAYQLYRLAQRKDVKHGVVQDKLWMPGIIKLKRVRENGFLGRILSVRAEFGYWVFEGKDGSLQRPSWNYRAEDGGSIILDMFPHWRYILDDLFGQVKAVSCVGATHIDRRWDEEGQSYVCTADDSAYSTFELEGNVIAHFNSSWAVRVKRDDLFSIQVDGTQGSAVCGLRECLVQARGDAPYVTWNPDVESPINHQNTWTPVFEDEGFGNGFRMQWEAFLKHVVADEPFPWNLLEGAKGVQLAEKGLESWKQRCWVDIPELKL
jgi:predicted dehydrogenase